MTLARAFRLAELTIDVAVGLVVVREVWRTLRFRRRCNDQLAELAELQARADAGDELAALRILKLAGARWPRRR